MIFRPKDDALNNLADIDDELSKIPPRDELEQMFQFSSRHNKRMDKLFAQAENKRKIRTFYRNAKNTAAVAAVVMAIAFGTLMTNKEIRTSILETAKSMEVNLTNFAAQETPVPETPKNEWNIQYVPAGFENCSVSDEGQGKELVYKNNSGESITFFYQPVEEISVEPADRIPPEIGGGLGRVYRSTKVNGVEYQYVLAQGDIQENEITWQQDGYQFVLSSKIDPNVLQEMAISVKK